MADFTPTVAGLGRRFQLRFQSLFNQGRAMTFPCNEAGQVDLDALSECARQNYFYARTVIGREYAVPAVLPVPC